MATQDAGTIVTFRELNALNTRRVVAFAEKYFDIKFTEPHDKERRKEYIGEIIKKAHATAVPISGIPAEVLVKLGLRDSAASVEEVEDLKAKGMEKRIRITIHPADNEPQYITISVNGRTIQITREEEVAIQEPYFQVLENANQNIHLPDGTVKTVPRFNYTVHGEVLVPMTAPVPLISDRPKKEVA